MIMSDVDVDGAYEWLIVVVGIILGIMSSYPLYFWGDIPEASASLQAVRSVVLPLVVSAVLWLMGKLILDQNRMLVVKFVAWMYSLATTAAFFLNYLMGVNFLVIKGEMNQAIVGYSVLFLFSPVFVYGVVYPLYKRKYPDAIFFRNKLWLILTLVIFFVLIFGVLYLTAQAAKIPITP